MQSNLSIFLPFESQYLAVMNRKLLLSCLSLLFILNQSIAQCPELVWSDEFDGEVLDLENWTHQIGDGCPNLCGWGNNELQYYQSNNASVSDGTLKITAKQESVGGKSYTSSRLRSLGKADFTYGRMEARIKLPTGKGLWPAFWMLSTSEPYGGWPQSGEIDIMELVGDQPEVVHGTIHYGPEWPQNKSTGEEFRINQGIFNDDFHLFSIEWDPGEIRWYVDNYLFSTKSRNNVLPDRWPFDHDFHFLLNVAVGGNWPGNPDASTSFPQVMEVDFVRVYDLTEFPHFVGDRLVEHKAEGVPYRVDNVPEDASIEWTVPEGATIVSGQGTASVEVNWGELGGNIIAEVSSACFNSEYTLNVNVSPAFQKSRSLENFDEEALVVETYSDGMLSEINNPAPNDINASEIVGRYGRNAETIFDVIVYSGNPITNASDFINGEKKLFVDVLTDATIGTEILLQLENQFRAGSDFPSGRNSRFQAFTTKQNEWERIEFAFLDQPDRNTSNTSIDQLVFLFAPNTQTGNTYHFDNFDIYEPQIVVSNIDQNIDFNIHIMPNPTRGEVIINNKSEVNIDLVKLYTLNGKLLMSIDAPVVSNDSFRINISDYPDGVYILKLESGQEQVFSKQLMLNK